MVSIPLEGTRSANTRLAPVARSAGQLVTLILAMRADTIDAVLAVDTVRGAVFVVDDPATAGGDHVVVQSGPGLNAALTEAAALRPGPVAARTGSLRSSATCPPCARPNWTRR